MSLMQYQKTDIDDILVDLDRIESVLRSGVETDLPPDPPPIIIPKFSLVAISPTVIEGAGVAQFEGRLSEPTTAVVTVRIRHQSNTAVVGEDFDAVDVVLRFDPGEQIEAINVPVKNDAAVEADESFGLIASEAQGCTIEVGSASVIIKSDDVAPSPVAVSILTPLAGVTLAPGQTVNATGSGDNLKWAVDLWSDGKGDFAIGAGPTFTFVVPSTATVGQRVQIKLTGDGGTSDRFYDVTATAPDPIPLPEPQPIPPTPTTVSDEIPPIASGPVSKYGETTYPTALAAINACPPGGKVFILPGRHVGQKAFVGAFTKKITIVGILDSQKRRPFLDGSGVSVPNGMLTPNADIIVEYLGFTNVHNNNNAAGIWTQTGLDLLIARWCMFKSNDNGFLGSIGNPNQKHLFEDCYFIDNGYGATKRSHNLYGGAGEETKLVRVRSHAPYDGMCAKTRCRRFIIEDSEMIQGAKGNYALDMPNGGVFIVKRSIVRKPSNNPGNTTMIQMCGDITNPDNQVPEGGNIRRHEVLFEDSILDNQLSYGIVVNNSLNPQTTAIVRRCQLPGSKRMEGLVRIEN